jgi:eukaryotic-like serine/threonine-protein kinase
MTPAKIGRYSIVRSVGARSEGLYLGEQGSRRVVIRVPAENQSEASDEARKIAALSHQGIAQQEVGLFDDQVFLASEVGSASTLEEWLSKGGSLGEQLLVVETIADALGYLHGQGLLHRALKPANVFMGSEGCRLANFGLAPSATALGDDATVYGAPEVLEGMPDTAQSDIYSAGVLFYEVLAGRREEARDGRVAKPLREIRPDLSRDVADAVTACRERSPDWRPKDLSYLIEVVRRARGSTGAAAPRPTPPRAAATRPGSTPSSRRSAAPTFATRRPARSPIPILIGIGVVLVGGAAAWFLTRPTGGAGSGAAPLPPPTTAATAPPATTEPVAGATPAPATTPNGAKPNGLGTATPAPAGTRPPPTTIPAGPPPTTEPRLATPRPVVTLPAVTLPPPTTIPPPPTTLARVEAPPPANESAEAPLVLTAVSPPMMRRGARTLVDVRGTGLRGGMQPTLLRGRAPAEGLRIVSQRFVNTTLIQIFFEADGAAPTGTYTLSLGDERGASNSVRFDVK